MIKKYIAAAAAACISIIAATWPVMAQSQPQTEYTVTYRPGKAAKFSDALIETYKSHYEVKVTQTGSVKIKVGAGQGYPKLPTDQDMVYEERQKYSMNTDWYPAKNAVTGNEDYVVKYSALKEAVEYQVRYVDVQSREDVAVPVIAQGNVGQSYHYGGVTVSGYACVTPSQELTLQKDAAKNVIIFQYNSTMSPVVNEVLIPGSTITSTEYVQGGTNQTVQNIPGTGAGTGNTPAAADANAAGTVPNAAADGADGTAQGAAPGNTVIPEENVPLAQNPDGTAGNEEENGEAETILEEDVPLAEGKEVLAKNHKGVIYAGIFAGILALAGIGLFIFKKVRAGRINNK